MQAQVQDAGTCKKQLTIEISPEEVKTALETTIGELRRNAIIPGFRKGHAPVSLLEKRFGGDIRKDVKAHLVFENYKKAVEEQKLQPVAEPDIDIDAIEMKEGEGFKFDVVVEVWPEFEATGYEGLTLEKPNAEPAPEEIDAEILNLRTRTTTFENIETEGAAETDFVIAAYDITADGETVSSAKEAGIRPADSVVGRIKVDGLKDALVGKKAGDKVTQAFKIDAEYYEEKFRGKDASVTIDVKSVRRPHMPEATDEWAKELGFESLEELKGVVGRNVAAGKESRADEALKAQIYDKLAEMIKMDLPEDMVRRQQADIIHRERMGLQYRGVSEEDLAKISDKLEEASLERAAKDLKLFFILSSIAGKEGVQATQADVDMKIAELATRYRTTTGKMRERLEREEMLPQIALQIREEKTISLILSKAVITEAAAAKAEGAPEAKEEAKEAQPKKPRVSKAKKNKEASAEEAEESKEK